MIALKIYLIGFIIALAYSIKILSDDGKIDVAGLLFSVVMGVMSWLGVLALLVAQSIKNNR